MRLQSWMGSLRVQARDLFSPALSDDPLPRVAADKARALLASFYMPNIPRAVVAAQRRLLKRFTPPDIAIAQIMTLRSHERALTHLFRTTPYRVVVVLDIDCVPISSRGINRLVSSAERGALVGAAQRAGHIQNNNHIYVGPFCFALSRETYAALQPVSFHRTPVADVGEELTYAAERKGIPVDLLWPSSSDDSLWELRDGITFGHGTTYENDFWHAFEIRLPSHHQKFVERCTAFDELGDQVLKSNRN